ncbi:hypothetical protein, partial [Burkholderia mallei]|uniref:hypothetical protein n=1 Tax=Burkholderia mallei TaxID=13373 RepID=UPI001E4EA801
AGVMWPPCGDERAAAWGRQAGGGVASDMRGRDARDSMRSACEERHAGGGVQAACAAAPRIKRFIAENRGALENDCV